MNQVGFDEHWLEVIRSYVVPVNGKVYPGYYSKVSSWLCVWCTCGCTNGG